MNRILNVKKSIDTKSYEKDFKVHKHLSALRYALPAKPAAAFDPSSLKGPFSGLSGLSIGSISRRSIYRLYISLAVF